MGKICVALDLDDEGFCGCASPPSGFSGRRRHLSDVDGGCLAEEGERDENERELVVVCCSLRG